MDARDKLWHFTDMDTLPRRMPAPPITIPAWNLYGESQGFPDVLHIETITDRASMLDWQIAPHRHPHLHQFSLILDGQAQITLDGQSPPVTAPFLLSVPHAVVHGFTFSAGTEGWVLTVPLQTLPELLEPTLLQDTALGRAGILPVDAVILSLFERISTEHASLHQGRAIMLRALASELACLVLRGLSNAQDTTQTTIDPRFLRFQSLLNQHLRDRWTLSDYARAIGVSERHLSRICHGITGQPAAKQIEAALMREACRLLAYTPTPIAQIGYALGFDDPSYFSRSFRRVTGLSPGAYRAGFDS